MRHEQHITLKDGTAIILRSLEKRDAAAAIFCLRKVSGETEFLLREAGECGMTIAQEEEIITRRAESPREALLGVFAGQELIGMASLNAVGMPARVRHRAVVGISLVSQYWGKGIGTAVLRALIALAEEAGYEQIELDVVDNNTRAIALYERLGFQLTGRIPDAMKYRGGRYGDLLLMIRPLGKTAP